MLRNALYGIATAKALGVDNPSLGVLNLEAAPQVMRALTRLRERGYPVRFGESVRKDGGTLLRGNDLLAGATDVCVCDTLTGNALMKVFAAFTSGGSYETSGWGYGPSAGEGWNKVVSIISRASGCAGHRQCAGLHGASGARRSAGQGGRRTPSRAGCGSGRRTGCLGAADRGRAGRAAGHAACGAHG